MSILQNNRFRIGVGILAVALAAGAIGAGTYAAFSDTETGPNGTVTAGTLDLVVGGTSGTVNLFNVVNMKPGTFQDSTFQVSNTGSIPGTLTSTITVTDSKDNICTEPESVAEGVALNGCAPAGNLPEQLTVEVINGPGGAVGPVSLSSFIGTGLASPGTLGSTPFTYTLRFALPNLPGTTNNRVQGDSIAISSTFDLVQA